MLGYMGVPQFNDSFGVSVNSVKLMQVNYIHNLILYTWQYASYHVDFQSSEKYTLSFEI